MNEEKRKRRELKHRYVRAQKYLFQRGGMSPGKAEWYAKREADKVAKVSK